MRNKGFTLIELLAVIVILAIIAFIATPIILGIINDTKKEASKRSVEMYAKAVENAIMSYQMKENKMPTTYEDIKEYIKYDGQEITVDRLDIYEDGSIYIEGIKSGEELLSKSYGIKYYKDGEEVYIDVTTGKKCTNYHEDNSKTGYNGLQATKTTDNQNSCLKFYAFLDDGSKNLNLLLDHNTSAKLAWTTASRPKRDNGPLSVTTNLKGDTKDWNVPIISKNYKYEGNNSYIIKYKDEEYKARLITANEIAQITKADKEDTLKWKEESSTGWYYFHNYSQDATTGRGDVCKTNGCIYGWLYDRTATDCTIYGCLNDSVGQTDGYWLSSALTENTYRAWNVDCDGRMYNYSVDGVNYYGVRPVIEVLKSNLK